MRILVLGAGGTGGYFGGRLAQAGADVTFLVRDARRKKLEREGLRIRSPLGDAQVAVTTVTAELLGRAIDERPFDLVLLSCKAYDLESAMDAIAPAMQARADVLPILNGLRHYAALDSRFGRDHVIGGLCFISAALGAEGEILHLGRPASMTFGERDADSPRNRLVAFAQACAAAHVDHRLVPDIAREQWIKYSFLTALAAGTCLMRANIGAIVATEGGVDFMRGLYAECTSVAAAEGQPVVASAQVTALGTLTQAGSDLKASMLRDLEAGNRIEAAQIVGDMVERARAHAISVPLLEAAWVNLQLHEAASSRPPSA